MTSALRHRIVRGVAVTVAGLFGACQGTTAASVVESSSPNASDEEAGWILLGVGVGLLAVSATTAVVSQGEMSAYLDQHALEIEVALARGAGPFVSDVADLVGADAGDVRAIGEALRADRRMLVARLRERGREGSLPFWHEAFVALDRAPETHALIDARAAQALRNAPLRR